MAGRIAGQGSKWIRPVKRLAIYHRDNLACVYCLATMEQGARLTLDHVVPCLLGGTNEAGNLVTACLACNSAKQARSVAEFAIMLADRGVNPDLIADRVRVQTGRDLAPHMATARAIEAARGIGAE